MKRRVVIVILGLCLWSGVVVARLAQIQISRHEDYVRRAARQQERTLELNPMRGSILDRNGRVLAESVVATSVYADPQAIVDPKSTAKKLAGIEAIGSSAQDLEKRLSGSGEFAWVARQLPREAGERVRELALPGIYFVDEHRRSYPKGKLAANLLGYVSIDGEGLAGAEHAYDKWARGKPGKATLLRDARRGMYLVGAEGAHAPVEGLDVVLTIDEVIQFIAEKELRSAIRKWDAPAGSVVVLDPTDGALLALASWPTFDPNEFGRYAPASWRNRPVQDLYEPGSTFKIVAAAAAIEEGIVTPSQMIDAGDGGINIGSVRIREHDSRQFGLVSFADVIAGSSNVGTIRVATSLGNRGFYDWVRRFGFGSSTGVGLPGEASGILRPPERWSSLSNAVMSIGQEIAVTPLQLAVATAAIANGGELRRPQIVERVVDREDRVVWKPERPAPVQVVSDRTAAILNEILKGVVTRGTGQQAGLAEHVAAGKTGTAQVPARGGYHPTKTIASFTGYAPADRPRLVILVVIEDPRGGGYGGAIAAPVFRAIAEDALRYLDVPASIPRREVEIAPAIRLAAFSQLRGEADPTPTAAAVGSPGSVVIPDFRGLDARLAVARATRAGLEVRAVGRGVVAEQSPAPGASPEHARVELIMSRGAEELNP